MNTDKKTLMYREYYKTPDIHVREDGNAVYRYYKGDYQCGSLPVRPPTFLKIHSDKKTGKRYIKTRDYGIAYIDRMVARCFCHKPEGADFLIHVDGNEENCHKNNLKWVDYQTYNMIMATRNP